MYCRKCGAEMSDDQSICIKCGVAQNSTQNNVAVSNDDGKNSILWGLLSFFIPTVGLILYCVWSNDRPKDAKAAGKGALISVIVSIGSVILVYLIIFLIGASFIALY